MKYLLAIGHSNVQSPVRNRKYGSGINLLVIENIFHDDRIFSELRQYAYRAPGKDLPKIDTKDL